MNKAKFKICEIIIEIDKETEGFEFITNFNEDMKEDVMKNSERLGESLEPFLNEIIHTIANTEEVE